MSKPHTLHLEKLDEPSMLGVSSISITLLSQEGQSIIRILLENINIHS
jgi:hypothetical protein